MEKQVLEQHYDFSKYVSRARWISYYHQINELSDISINTVLLIGKGDEIVENILKKMGKNVTTFDFDEKLFPDIVGDVCEIDKFVSEKYDAVICCQVLEHIPFEKFEKIIEKIKKITISKFILSLPRKSTYIKFSIRMIGFNEFCIMPRIPIFWKRKFRFEIEGFNEHYWEIGIPKISNKKIIHILNQYFCVEKSYFDKENTYHQFFICKNK